MKYLIPAIALLLLLTILANRTQTPPDARNDPKPYFPMPKPIDTLYKPIALFIKRHEGFRKYPYDNGTIGYGTKVNLKHVTPHEATLLMRDHIQRDYDALSKHLPRKLALAMCPFAYNCGLTPALKIAKSKRFERILLYTHAKGKQLPGLVKRRKAEYQLIQKALR